MSKNAAPANNQRPKTRTKWYQKTWVIVIAFVIFFPLGFYLLWRQPSWSKRTKKITTGLASVAIIAMIALSIIFAPPSVDVTSALSPVRNSGYTLTGKIYPSNAEVTVNGKKASVDNDKFTAHLKLKEGDNKITIDVIDGSKKTEEIVTVHRYTKAEIAKQEKEAADKKKKAEEAAAKKKAQQEAANKKKQADAAAKKAKQQADAAAKKAKQQADAAAAAAKKQAEEAAKQPKVVLDISGSGIKQTQPFTTKSRWTITYTFNCASFGYQGNFQIYVNNTDGSYNTDSGANDLAMSGGDTDYFYDAGEHYLTINSECDWHVTVKS